MLKITHLRKGRVPPKAVCSFKDVCPYVPTKECTHKGEEQKTSMHCNMAKTLEIIIVTRQREET